MEIWGAFRNICVVFKALKYPRVNAVGIHSMVVALTIMANQSYVLYGMWNFHSISDKNPLHGMLLLFEFEKL